MKHTLIIIFIVFASSLYGQNLMRCNDSISYFLSYKNDYSCSIMLKGNIVRSENPRVINYNDYSLQTLFVDKQNYITDKTDDTPILTNYMISETQYFTSVYKEKLNLMMIPVQINPEKTAVIWYFDIPESIQKGIPKNETPAVKQVSISIVLDSFIYSIGITQFKDQDFEELKDMLADLIKTIKFQKGNFEQKDLCKTK